MHIDFVAVSENATSEGLDALFAEAARLATLDEVVSAGVIEAGPGSDFELAFLFVLRDFAALEPFGTSPMYSRFLQGYIAPVLRLLAGADVRLEGDMPAIAGQGACLALAADDETYDWEVSDTLNDWSRGLEAVGSVVGIAMGERQRFRGVGLAFGDAPLTPVKVSDERFTSTLVMGKARSLR
jgi:hypothetical protein